MLFSAVWKRLESNEEETHHFCSANLFLSRPNGEEKQHIILLYVILKAGKEINADFRLTVA